MSKEMEAAISGILAALIGGLSMTVFLFALWYDHLDKLGRSGKLERRSKDRRITSTGGKDEKG